MKTSEYRDRSKVIQEQGQERLVTLELDCIHTFELSVVDIRERPNANFFSHHKRSCSEETRDEQTNVLHML